MVILSVVSAKGGVGKTTLGANLAHSIAKERNVFALDLDPQNALRLHFSSGSRELDGVARAELGHRPWGSCVRQPQKPFVMPFGAVTDEDVEKFEKRLKDQPDRLMAELHALPLQASDLVIVDTPAAWDSADALVIVKATKAAVASNFRMMHSPLKKCLSLAVEPEMPLRKYHHKKPAMAVTGKSRSDGYLGGGTSVLLA